MVAVCAPGQWSSIIFVGGNSIRLNLSFGLQSHKGKMIYFARKMSHDRQLVLTNKISTYSFSAIGTPWKNADIFCSRFFDIFSKWFIENTMMANANHLCRQMNGSLQNKSTILIAPTAFWTNRYFFFFLRPPLCHCDFYRLSFVRSWLCASIKRLRIFLLTKTKCTAQSLLPAPSLHISRHRLHEIFQIWKSNSVWKFLVFWLLKIFRRSTMDFSIGRW